MLIRPALDIPFAFQGVEAVNGGFVGEDLAARLDLADQRRLPVLIEIPRDERQHQPLFFGHGELGQGSYWVGKLTIIYRTTEAPSTRFFLPELYT